MALSVRQLKELVAGFADTDLVILQTDAEGNGHTPLAGGYDAIYVAASPDGGDVYLRQLTDAERKEGWTEDDLYHGTDGQPVLVLYPVR